MEQGYSWGRKKPRSACKGAFDPDKQGSSRLPGFTCWEERGGKPVSAMFLQAPKTGGLTGGDPFSLGFLPTYGLLLDAAKTKSRRRQLELLAFHRETHPTSGVIGCRRYALPCSSTSQ